MLRALLASAVILFGAAPEAVLAQPASAASEREAAALAEFTTELAANDAQQQALMGELLPMLQKAADALEQGPDQAKPEAAMGRLPGLAKRRNDLHQARLESVSR